MGRWVAGPWAACLLLLAGCQKPEEAAPAPPARAQPDESPPRPLAVVELPETPAPAEATPPETPEPPPGAPSAGDEEAPPSRLLLTDSDSWERPEGKADAPEDGGEEAWFREAAQAARAGNTRISVWEPLESVTIASGTVDGRVTRVRPGTLEVSDEEGNVYELRLDGRSRGLRRGRHVPLKSITEGTRVRASFDLVGGGDSLARDIQLRR